VNSGSDIGWSLGEFLSGRKSFDELVAQLALIVTDDANADVLEASLQHLVNSGQLPHDLAVLIWRRSVAPDDGRDPSAVDFDEPDDSAASQAGAEDDGHPAGDQYQQKVDDVVVSALLDGFRSYRKKTSHISLQVDERPDSALDAALADFRSVRFRRDAQKAESGQPRSSAGAADPSRNHSWRAVGVGSMLKDRFVLDKELGRGGMGVVFRAVDRRRLEAMHTAPYVAIKVLNDNFKDHPDALRALESEARKAQELAHPSIVTVFDFDRDQGNVFIVMELLQGAPLDQVLAADGAKGLDGAIARKVIDNLCEGLAYAHGRGVVHADIKPANIFLSNEGAVKLLDFGIAAAGRHGSFDATTLSAYTAAYASPEMQDGEGRDPRDDVYALGCVAYMVLGGQHPFDRLSGSDVRVRGLRPLKLKNVSDPEWIAIARALSIRRDERQPDAGAFHRQFQGHDV
jgi:hypothetical protein